MIDDLLNTLEESDSVTPEVEYQIINSITVDCIDKINGLPIEQLAAQVEHEDQEPSKDLRALISTMKFPDKIKLALLGNSSCRTLLVQDKNKLISLFVLKNPKITPKEIEEFAKNTNIAAHILRAIAGSNEWIKTYSVKLGLVMNPKTPPDISLKLLKFINSSDLKRIAKSKNLPQVLVMGARKMNE